MSHRHARDINNNHCKRRANRSAGDAVYVEEVTITLTLDTAVGPHCGGTLIVVTGVSG